MERSSWRGVACFFASLVAATVFGCQGGPKHPPVGRYTIEQLSSPPVVDGRDDDPVWNTMAWSREFTRSNSQPADTKTRAKLGWYGTTLYAFFQTADDDIHGTFTARDAPLYREQAHELFINPSGIEQGSAVHYVELQVNPLGAQFDAEFRGGARKNMNRGFNPDWHAAVVVDGTVGKSDDVDRGWQSEWALALPSIVGDPSLVGGMAKSDRCWRVNMFHVGKKRDPQGRLRADETAWSAPLVGDFHTLNRFGEMCFRGTPSP